MRGFSSTLLALLLISSILQLFEPAQTAWTGGTIYIKADGSVEPVNAPITTRDRVTYTLTDDIITEGIVVERDNIILDGNGYKVTGQGRGYGIRLENRRNIIVRNLKIEKFATGIYLWNSSGITITGNTISNNGDGIYLWNSSGNRVFLNNFIGNVRQVYSLGSVNVWDDGFRGNYWSDYRGEDRNNDGIGDTPYTIDEKNVDRYPLIHPYGYLPVKVTSLYGTTSGEGWYEKGSTATISVSPVLIDHGNGTRRVFSGWYDEKGNFLSSEPVFSLTVDKPYSITARWDTKYRVEAYSPYGSVTGSNWYKRGSTVTISVSPTVVEGFFTRHVFEGWIAEGRLISTTPTYSFTVDKPVTLIASWKTEINLPAALSLAALLLLIILFRQRLAPRKITEMQKLRLENEQLKRELQTVLNQRAQLQQVLNKLQLENEQLKRELERSQGLYWENEQLKRELQTVLNQRAQLQQVLNKLQLENEQLKRIINPPRAQIVELYNELVERVLRERDYVDTTILDKLLMEAQHSVERGDLSYARYLLEVVKNMINDNEVLVRLRRLYQIGIKSGYTPTIL